MSSVSTIPFVLKINRQIIAKRFHIILHIWHCVLGTLRHRGNERCKSQGATKVAWCHPVSDLTQQHGLLVTSREVMLACHHKVLCVHWVQLRPIMLTSVSNSVRFSLLIMLYHVPAMTASVLADKTNRYCPTTSYYSRPFRMVEKVPCKLHKLLEE